jgi:uncharacterized protein
MRGAKGIPCVKTSEFKAGDSTLLGGWHYLPDQRTGKVPTVVMPHGFASVKEMYLDKYAELGAQSGIASLVYDHRCFGASDGGRNSIA